MDPAIVFCAQYLIVAVVAILAYVWFSQNANNKKQMLITGLIAGAIAVVLAQIAAALFYNPRPFVGGQVAPLFAHGPDNGFPSDHAWFTMTLTAIIFYYNRRLFYVSLLATVVIGAARVAAHVHSPIDIVAGILIGIVAAVAGYWAANQLLNRHSTKA